MEQPCILPSPQHASCHVLSMHLATPSSIATKAVCISTSKLSKYVRFPKQNDVQEIRKLGIKTLGKEVKNYDKKSEIYAPNAKT